MSQVNIQHLMRRYHLQEGQGHLRPRLDDLTETLFREYLQDTLDSLAVRSNEIVCIRELYVPIKFTAGKTDFEIFEDWRNDLFHALRNQLVKRSSHQIVQYPSLIEALKSIARSLTLGLNNHHWAWNQIGITKGTDNCNNTIKVQWIDYLITHPELIIPVMKGLMSEDTFAVLIFKGVISAAELSQLTDACFRNLRLEVNWRIAPDVQFGSLYNKISRSNALKHLNDSHWIWTIITSFKSPSVVNLKREAPDNTMIESLIKSLFWSIFEDKKGTAGARLLTRKNVEQHILTLAQWINNLDHMPTSVPLKEPVNKKLPLATELYSDQQIICPNSSQEPLISEFGGLLFCLNALGQSETLARLQGEELDDYSISQLLENLCWMWLPQSKGDAVVDVFSGRIFESRESMGNDQVLSETATESLANIAQQFKQTLSRTLANLEGADNDDGTQLFEIMCRRRVRIEAQPGWVNVFFELDSADSTIRSAGLDLDPDFVPWLGYTVKFYYE